MPSCHSTPKQLQLSPWCAHCLSTPESRQVASQLCAAASVLDFVLFSQTRQSCRPNRFQHGSVCGLAVRVRLLPTPFLNDAVAFRFISSVQDYGSDFHLSDIACFQTHENAPLALNGSRKQCRTRLLVARPTSGQ